MENIDTTTLPEWQQKEPFAQLQAWFNKTYDETSKDMRYRESFSRQFMFFRDAIMYDIFRKSVISLEAISSHRSKSVVLPVYKVVLKDGTTIIARNNFNDWKVSVLSKKDLEFPLSLLNDGGKRDYSSVYFEGFRSDWVLGSYLGNKREFSVEIQSGEHHMWTFLFLLNEQIKSKIKVGDIVSPTKESGEQLACGTGRYSEAVVISVEPFIITSTDSTMRWSDTIFVEDFEITGEADESTLNNCMRRIQI